MTEHLGIPIVDPLAGTVDAFTLDHAAWTSLNGPHGRFAEARGQAVRYPVDVSPFAAVAPDADERAWEDLGALVGPGTVGALPALTLEVPGAWEVLGTGQGVQMVATSVAVAEEPEAVRLGPGDVPEMLELTARTKPGPFLPRTVELGTYLGIRRAGTLVAMAGERLHPPGWTEISAVCTDADYRGQGLASRLVRAVAADIVDRGDRPFLHAAAANVTAIRLYHSLGFTLRRLTTFTRVQVPGAAPLGHTAAGAESGGR